MRSDDIPQLRRDDLKTMSADEIVAAHREGRLADVLAGREPTPTPDLGGFTVDELRRLAPDSFERLQAEGVLDGLLEAEAAKLPSPTSGFADLGARGVERPRQLSQTDLDGMSPSEIVQAHTQGLFNDLLRRSR